MRNYLNFESEIKELENELSNLRDPYNNEGISEVNTKEIQLLEKKINKKLEKIYSDLNPLEKTQVARHEERPKAKYFIENLFNDFISLSGDNYYGEDKSIIAGFAKFENKAVLVIGQEKGENLEERLLRNFGMVTPAGYNRAVKLMKIANKFNIPIITFIDTPGASPTVSSEEKGQSEAIAKSIETCINLKVPNISIIIGEGGSGGAIALATSNKVIMLENSVYSVISPEGCASILWRDSKKTLEAATAMKMTAKDLLKFNIIDEIIEEPIGGAHRDREKTLENIRLSIKKNLENFESFNEDEIILHRKNKFLQIGRNKGYSIKSDFGTGLSFQKNRINSFLEKILINKKIFIGLATTLAFVLGLIYLL